MQRSAAQLPWRHHQYLLDKLDDQPTRQPSIGLLLCQTKNDVVAEYALRGHSAPIGVAE